MKDDKKGSTATYSLFCLQRGSPLLRSTGISRGWARDPCPFSVPSGQRRIRPARCYAVRGVRAGPRGVPPLPGSVQFPPEGTGKDGFFHLVDALQDVFGSFPGLLLLGKDAVQDADDLLLFGEGGKDYWHSL